MTSIKRERQLRWEVLFAIILTPSQCSRSLSSFRSFRSNNGICHSPKMNPQSAVLSPLFSRHCKQLPLRGGFDEENCDSSQDTENNSPPRKKTKIDNHSSGTEETFDKSVECEDDTSSTECLNCRKLIKHAHSNISDKETSIESRITMTGHKLEPFALDFFSSLDGLPVTVEAYNVLLEHCYDTQDLTSALALYEKMKNESLAPTYETCDYLMSICENAKEWGLAVNLAEDMLATGLCTNERTYEWMIKICAKLKEWDIVLGLYDELIQNKLEPSTNIRVFAIQACQGQRLWRRAIDELNNFRKHSPAASLPFSYVIEACLDAGQNSEAQKLIDEHQNLQNKELQHRDIVEGAADNMEADIIQLVDPEEHETEKGSVSRSNDSPSDGNVQSKA